MKDKEAIKERLKKEEIDVNSYKGFLFENKGDYARGWVAALRWVLKKELDNKRGE